MSPEFRTFCVNECEKWMRKAKKKRSENTKAPSTMNLIQFFSILISSPHVCVHLYDVRCLEIKSERTMTVGMSEKKGQRLIERVKRSQNEK